MALGKPRLSARLAELAKAHPTGTLGVDDFMATALYDVEGGYYMRAGDIGGQRRDFSTIPSLSPLLGRAIVRWALAQVPRGPLDIIEVGAGGGHLGASILAGAGWWSRRRIRYHIVEISPRLRTAQQALLKGRRVTWHDSTAEAVTACPHPVVLSNELVDAFPCRLLRFENEEWRELRLDWPPEGDAPLVSHPQDEDLSPFTACDPVMWPGGIPEGQVIEIQPAFRRWLKGWEPAAAGAEVLTIDYGDVMPELYRDRAGGTLRGYFSHQRLTGPAVFRAPGQVDLTCDVNFTDLQAWGMSNGLRTVELTDQAGFLTRWLPEKEKERHASDLARITDPDGAGGAFKVLWQSSD